MFCLAAQRCSVALQTPELTTADILACAPLVCEKLQLDEAGRPPTNEMLANCVNAILCQSHADPPTPPKTVEKTEAWEKCEQRQLQDEKKIQRDAQQEACTGGKIGDIAAVATVDQENLPYFVDTQG